MPDPASITLSNGAVVRVGDVVPMIDGTWSEVLEIDAPDSVRPICMSMRRDWPLLSEIDAAKLAKHRATLQPASAQTAGIAELVATFRKRADANYNAAQAEDKHSYERAIKLGLSEAYHLCADALAALGGEDS